ncbi:MOSC domain protein [Aspergillus sclerotialis]|uniref:MOSC domain protein n=1 Tax=Aspergillus sclerotialis TaxID=2070753 RepID=A0A3A2ZQ03_9EURO|nr:MOSC domain protein [Aspergillus sclerotialis]
MSPTFDVSELEKPWQTDRVMQVRTGKAKPVFGRPIESAIFKTIREGPVPVSKLGCEGDEHVYEFHGGVDKALHQYCTRHYKVWKNELPDSSHLFRVGGFGENIVARNANERNTCIGDIVRIGSKVIAQVSLPRQPCYKLNHRFQEQNMSRYTQERFRTGWFYRVLQEGSIQAGDEIVLLERPNPDWTIARVQHYLYIEKDNFEVMKQVVEIKGLGNESRNIFINRLNKNGHLAEYRLVQKTRETSNVVSLVLQAVEPRESPEGVQPGTHIRLKLGGKLIRAYSVVSGNQNRFMLGVSLDRETSRGGSLYIHDTLRDGDVITVSKFADTFPLSKEADRHVLIAGGIGITGLLASAKNLQERGQAYHLHYAVRDPEEVAFESYLEQLKPNVTVYSKKLGNPLDVSKVMQQADTNTHIYCCAGERLRAAVSEVAKELGLPEASVHFESFQVDSTGDPFVAELAESGKDVEVPGGESLLDTLRAAGFDIPSTCEAGNCGTCRVGVRSGKIDHRGTGLVGNEKDTAMLSCVSRGIGRIVLDL